MSRVSVIIPTFNRASMVCEAIDSVLAQTVTDVEIIVVDDGSTDGTGEILSRRYEESIRYHYQENHGRSVARNRGIRLSSGEFLVFLDSDDWLLPKALEVHLRFAEAHPEADVIYGDGYYCDQNGEPLQRISEERPPVPEEGLVGVMVLHNVVVAPHSAMVRRLALEMLGDPWFDEQLDGPEDADLWLRLAVAGARFVAHSVPVCKYRLHGGNTFVPTHPRWSHHWQSMQRFKRKILDSAYFPNLPLAARREFLRQLLLIFYDEEPELQASVVASEPFRALPREDQAALLYYLGVETVLRHREDLEGGRRWLARAAARVPRRRYRVALSLCRWGGIPLRVLVGLRRRFSPRRADWLATSLRRRVGGGR